MKKSIVGNVVTFTFADNVAPYVFDCSALTDEIKAYSVPFAMGHRLGDNAAIQKSEENGFKVTEQMRRDAVAELGDYYAGGATEWNLKGAARAPKENPIILQIATKRKITYAEAEAFLAAQFLTDMTA